MPESVRKNLPFAAIFSTSCMAARRLARVCGASLGFVFTDTASASLLVRKVLAVAGQPVLRINIFQVPEGVLTIVAIQASNDAQHCTTLPKLYLTRNLGKSPSLGVEAKNRANAL